MSIQTELIIESNETQIAVTGNNDIRFLKSSRITLDEFDALHRCIVSYVDWKRDNLGRDVIEEVATIEEVIESKTDDDAPETHTLDDGISFSWDTESEVRLNKPIIEPEPAYIRHRSDASPIIHGMIYLGIGGSDIVAPHPVQEVPVFQVPDTMLPTEIGEYKYWILPDGRIKISRPSYLINLHYKVSEIKRLRALSADDLTTVIRQYKKDTYENKGVVLAGFLRELGTTEFPQKPPMSDKTRVLNDIAKKLVEHNKS